MEGNIDELWARFGGPELPDDPQEYAPSPAPIMEALRDCIEELDASAAMGHWEKHGAAAARAEQLSFDLRMALFDDDGAARDAVGLLRQLVDAIRRIPDDGVLSGVRANTVSRIEQIVNCDHRGV